MSSPNCPKLSGEQQAAQVNFAKKLGRLGLSFFRSMIPWCRSKFCYWSSLLFVSQYFVFFQKFSSEVVSSTFDMVESVRSHPSNRFMHVHRISPLGAACSRSAPTEVIQELLKHQADVNLRTGADGMVPRVVGNWKALGFWKYTCESSCMSSWQDVPIRELNHSSNWSLQVKIKRYKK